MPCVPLVDPVVRIRVAYDLAGAVDGAVRSLGHHFRASVTVKVVDHELGVVCSRADISSEVDSPESRAVELHAVDEGRAGVAPVGVVVGVGRIPFEEDLIFAVSVDITYRAVVGGVCRDLSVRHGLRGRGLYGYGKVALRSIGGKCEAPSGGLSRNRPHFVDGGVGGGIRVHEPAHVLDRTVVEQSAVAVDIEGDS